MLQHKIKYVKNRLPFRQFETQRLCSLHKGMTGGNCLIVQAERRAKRVSWQRSLSNHGCLTIPRTGDPSAEQGTLDFYHTSPAQCCASRSTLFYLSVFSSFLHQVFNVLCVTASSLSCSMCSFRKGVTRRLSTNSYADPLYQDKNVDNLPNYSKCQIDTWLCTKLYYNGFIESPSGRTIFICGGNSLGRHTQPKLMKIFIFNKNSFVSLQSKVTFVEFLQLPYKRSSQSTT